MVINLAEEPYYYFLYRNQASSQRKVIETTIKPINIFLFQYVLMQDPTNQERKINSHNSYNQTTQLVSIY